MNSKRLSGLVVFAGILWTIALQAHEVPAEPAPGVGDSIDVRVVNVEVVVTDRLGKRVTSLKPGDFELKVDGKPVPVEYFTEVKGGVAAAPAAEAGAPAAEALPGAEPGAAVGTNYLVFVDGLLSIQQQRNVVLAALKRELGSLGPEDRMSIVSWNGGRLVRFAGWTGSREELAQALDQAMAMPAYGIREQIELKRLLADERLSRGLTEQGWWDNDVLGRILGPNPGLSMAEIDYGRTLGYELADAAHAVTSTLRGTAAPPGRKVLLLLAGGWPFSLESYVRDGRPLTLSRELPENQAVLKSLADTANLLGYTIYPVDVPGLTSVSGLDITVDPLAGHQSALVGTPSAWSRVDGSSLNPLPERYTQLMSFREQEMQGTLEYLAQQTGGKPLLNGNRELALSRAGADTRSYYWLGFSPSWQRDGKSHKVAVSVPRKGLRARSRKGYLDLTQGEEAAMKVGSALLFGELPDAAPLAVHLGAPVRGKERRTTEIPVVLEIPASAVTMLPADGRYAGRAELRLAAMDDEGNQSDIPATAIKLDSPREPGPGALLHYTTRIYLRGRASQVVAVVYDPLSGALAAGKADVRVP